MICIKFTYYNPIMIRTIISGLLILFALLSFGQANSEYQRIDLKADSLYKFEIFSLGSTPQNINVPGLAYDSLSVEPLDDNRYELHIKFTENVVGETAVDIEYFAIGDIPGIPYPFYTTYHFRVYPSEVVTHDDVVISNQGVTLVKPLLNDSSSDGPVSLEHVAYTQNCTAEIVDDETINVTVENISENAYVSYIISDTLGTTQDGMIILIGESQSDDIELSLHNKTSIDIYVNNEYSIQSNASNGVLSEVFDHCWRYIPDESFVGKDTILFKKDGQLFSVITQVFDESLDVQFVKADEAFVAPGGSVTFNVLDNDLLNFLPIVDYSPELIFLGNGVFQYNASNTNFSGDLIFQYTIFNGFLFIQEDIVIHVDHFSPNIYGVDYNLQTGANSELSIIHHTPLKDYTMSIITQPSFGALTIVDNIYIGECDSTSVLNSIIYDPNGNVGNDFFEIEYCTTQEYCEIVRIQVNSIDDNSVDCTCLDDCIWEGDINTDGIVNSLDIMELGFNIGETGESRHSTDSWVAQESQDWKYHQFGSDNDLSHSDANGDGFIDMEDFEIVESNYGNVHDLLPIQAHNLLSSPVTLIPNQTQVDSGDLVIFYVHIGNEDHPIKDFSGLSFNFTINEDLIDSSSVYVDFYEDSWAGYGRPSKSFYHQMSGGNIDVAFTQIGSGGTSGIGPIAELGFIVEDEIGGLRLSEDFVNINVQFSNGVMLDQHGNKYSLPNSVGRTKMQVDTSNADSELSDIDDLSISIGPNPTHHTLTVSTVDSIIDEVQVFSINGMLQQGTHYDGSIESAQIDMSALTAGTYILKVIANDGRTESVKIAKF